ncbi:hypothetical protein [Hyphomicrobium sp. MC1]|nr:hypothetical protein [Hyphomicrobium sp. MC1]
MSERSKNLSQRRAWTPIVLAPKVYRYRRRSDDGAAHALKALAA